MLGLPESSGYPISSLTIRHFFPHVPIYLPDPRNDGSLCIPARGFAFVLPQEIQRIPDNVFDLCLNIDSFGEMSSEQVEGYLSLVQRSVKEGGLFMNLNRRKRIGNYDNNPLMYRYGPNEILRWETDPFMFHARRTKEHNKDGHLLRLERTR